MTTMFAQMHGGKMLMINADKLLESLREQRKQLRIDLANAKEKGWRTEANNLQARLQELGMIMKEVREMELEEDLRQLKEANDRRSKGAKRMKIGDEVYIHGFVDEIRKDCVIVKNEGGYFGTVPDEVFVGNEIAPKIWVPFGQGKPEDDELVMVTTWVNMIDDDIVSLATYKNGRYITPLGEDLTEKSTAWMPYPKPYRANDKRE